VSDRDSLLPSQPLQFPLQSLRGVPFRGQPATLHALRVSTARPVPVRPYRLPVPTRSLQPDQLALLRHRRSPLVAWRYEVIVMSTASPPRPQLAELPQRRARRIAPDDGLLSQSRSMPLPSGPLLPRARFGCLVRGTRDTSAPK
jgi:hypothetical protein